MIATVPNRTDFTYACKICSLENLHTKMEQTDLPVTKVSASGISVADIPTTTPLYLDTGDTLELSDGTTLYVTTGISVRYGYETFTSAIYTATSISFQAAAGSVPAKLVDSNYKFGDQHIKSNMLISISSTSTTNDGNYTIADRGVSRDEILLVSTDSLTTETAATAGSVIISQILFQPNILTGCPFCGSLNSVNGTPPN